MYTPHCKDDFYKIDEQRNQVNGCIPNHITFQNHIMNRFIWCTDNLSNLVKFLPCYTSSFISFRWGVSNNTPSIGRSKLCRSRWWCSLAFARLHQFCLFSFLSSSRLHSGRIEFQSLLILASLIWFPSLLKLASLIWFVIKIVS